MKPTPKDPVYTYRTALEGALDIDDFFNYNGEEEVLEQIELLGVYVKEYEDKISELRNLVENLSRYASLSDGRLRVPRKTMLHFKDTMKKANAWVVRNKNDRADEN
jgi:hypothetical protein|tara:strand:+ start:2423 stop:2740 length:318 start_codon:yes stop_codon:yes gene_type:complete